MNILKIWLPILLLYALPTMGAAQSGGNSLSGAQRVILKMEEDLFTAIKKHDGKALNRILADDFVYRSPGNPETGKGEFLKLISSIPIKILSLYGEELKVQVYGETAVLTGLQIARALNAEGREEIGATMFTDIFAKRKGRWQLVLAHAVELPQMPPQYLPK